MMKKYIYFIALVLTAASFASCSHDYNYDGEYDVKGYFGGSDPRNNLVYFSTTSAEYTNSFVGDLHLGDDSQVFKFTGTISRNLSAASKVQVSLGTDAPLLTTTYKDYAVATAEQVEFKNGGTIELGTETSNFEVPVTVKGLSKILKPTVVPVKVTPVGKELSSPEVVRRDYAYIVITPKDLWTVDYDGTGIVAALGNPTAYTDETTMAVEFKTAESFAYKGKIGLERDNSLFKSDGKTKLAPEGISTSSPVECEGERSLEVSVELTHPEKFTELGDYVLPIRAVYYDEKGGKHNLVNGEILIPIKVMDIYIASSKTDPTGTEVSTQDWKVTMNPQPSSGLVERLIDGDEKTGVHIRSGITNVVIDLGQKEDIKGLRLATDRFKYYYPKSVTFYGSDDNTNWKQLSGEIPVASTQQWNNYSILKPLSARYLKLEVNGSNYDILSEFKVYK